MQSEPASVSRRDLLSLIGAVSGSAAMYHAMTSLGFASELRIQGPDQARWRSEGRLRPDPRRRTCRHDGRAGIAQGGIHRSRFWSSTAGQEAATGPCGAGIPSRSSAASGRPANSNKASISIPGHGGFPITIARFWITASVSASRWSRSSSSITMRSCMPPARSAARRSAFAISRPISRVRFPNCSPRQRSRASLTRRSRKKIAKSCCRR